MTDVREVAFDTLLYYEKNTKAHVPVKDVLDKFSYLEKKDRSFLKRLIEGVMERRITIDFILNQFAKIPVNKQKPPVRVILRMGVYQIMYMDGVADFAAVNECVLLAKKRKLANLSGVINGILRNVSKNRDSIKWPDRKTDVIKYFSVIYSCPEWIVRRLVDEQGEENAETVLMNSVSTRPVTARVNLSKATVSDVLNTCFGSDGLCYAKQSFIKTAITFDTPDNISELPAIKEGLVCVQDISSMLVCTLAGIKESDTVLDVCASPGGKSLNAADIAVKGRVISCDVSEKKLERIEENIARCGFNNIETRVMDATEHCKEFDEIADVIIADVPCSGLGVMGRKNDIKYNLQQGQIEDLAVLAREILSNVTRYLKCGGTLMFSTCTVSKCENVDNAEFIESIPGFSAVSFYDELPDELKCESAKSGYMQLYGKDGLTDGFFIAKFRKQR